MSRLWRIMLLFRYRSRSEEGPRSNICTRNPVFADSMVEDATDFPIKYRLFLVSYLAYRKQSVPQKVSLLFCGCTLGNYIDIRPTAPIPQTT